MRWTITLWKRGSGGFGFGVWRTRYAWDAIWTIALGPVSIYVSIDQPGQVFGRKDGGA